MKEIAATKDVLGYKQCAEDTDCNTDGGEFCVNYTVSGTLDGAALDYSGNTCLTEKNSNCKSSSDEAGLIELTSETEDVQLQVDCFPFSILSTPGFGLAIICLLISVIIISVVAFICVKHKKQDEEGTDA